jgi:hypothetical protein
MEGVRMPIGGKLPGQFFKQRKPKPPIAPLAHILTKNENTVLCCSEFTCGASFSIPQDFTISEYPGLLLCQVSKDSQNQKRLIAYWRGTTFSQAHESDLITELGLASASWTGPVIDVRKPAEPFFKRHSLAASILAVAALFGALSAIRDYFSVLFAVPYVGLSYTDSANNEVDVIAGRAISLQLKMLSEVRFTPMKITFDSASIRLKSGGRQQSLQFDNAIFSSLPPGQAQTVSITGTAPEHSKAQPSPDIYEIDVAATAKAGILSQGRVVNPPARELWVWPTRSWASPLEFVSTAGITCVLGGTVYPSDVYPAGATVEIVYAGAPQEIANIYLDAKGSDIENSSFKDAGTGTNRVLIKRFKTPPLKLLEKYHYKVDLYLSDQRASKECQNWSAGFAVAVE